MRLEQLLSHPFQLVVPLVLLGATVLGGLIVRSILFRVVRAWAAGTEGNLGDILVQSVPVVLWSLILGIHLATQNSEIPKVYLRYIPRTLAVLWIVSLTVATSRLVGSSSMCRAPLYQSTPIRCARRLAPARRK